MAIAAAVSHQQLASLQTKAPDASLIILPAEKLHLLDHTEVKKMNRFALSTQRFLSSYDRAMDFIGQFRGRDVKRPRTMENIPKDCEVVFTQTFGDLGERLFLMSKSVSRDFSLTFGEYQKLSQGAYYQRLEALFSIADEPVQNQDFFHILPINEITKAVNNLTAVSVSWPPMANIYMANIYEMQRHNGVLKGEVAHLEMALEVLSKGENRLHELLRGRACSQTQLEQARARASIEKIDAQIVLIKKRIAYYVKKQGATNVDTFFQTMDAMKAVGRAASKAADGRAVPPASWVKDLNFIRVLLNKMARGKTLEKQIQAFNALQKFTSRTDNIICQVLIHADPILTLHDVDGISDDALPSRSTTFIDLPDVDEADLPDIGIVEFS